MHLLYNILIGLYLLIIRFFSLFDSKANLWLKGRKNQTLPNLINKKVIWMHCSSLGEFEQGRPVFEKLKDARPNYIFVLSFFSPSGYERLKNSDIAEYVLYLPIDLPARAKKFIDTINPEISIFVKYDFWYNYLQILNIRKLKVIYISVLLNHNHRLFSFYNKFILNELKKVDKIFTQNNATLKVLKEHSFKNVEKAGDTRVDRVLEIANTPFRDEKIENFISSKEKTIICGSTWEKDIDVLSESQDLISQNHNFIIAPHEISSKQIDYIKNSFKDKTVKYYTKINDSDSFNFDILIIDKIGILSRIYRFADIAYIGGGFGNGIHSTLEPASYTIPVIFGPHFKNFYEAVELVKRNSFFTIKNGSDFMEIMLSLNIEDNYLKAQKGINEFLHNNKNASTQIVSYIEK